MKTVGRWEKNIGIPADKLALLWEKKFDAQYILTGVRSGNVPDFEDKLAELQRVTERMMKIAESQSPKPDAYSLGPLRDLAYSANLSDEQIQAVLNLLHQARETSFWLGQTGSKQSAASKNRVTQIIHGDPKNSQITTGDMTVHQNVYNDKDDKK